MPETKSSGSRWWEYYAMRYALGVGIGTPFVFLLWRVYGRMLTIHIAIPSPFSSTVAALLWAAGGTAYCYVASAPMLTLHSTRNIFRRTRRRIIGWFVAIVVALSIAVVSDLFLIGNQLWLQILGVGALVVIATFQLSWVFSVLLKPGATHEFYDQLSKQRSGKSDFVESYRHMREHGNAISIVVLELLLAFILWSLRPTGADAGTVIAVGRIGVILAIWLLPSALVWLIGSSLERHLSRSDS